jgi:hypothetical protein
MANLLETIYKEFYAKDKDYHEVFSFIRLSRAINKEKYDAILDLQAQVSCGIFFSNLTELEPLNASIMKSEIYIQASK